LVERLVTLLDVLELAAEGVICLLSGLTDVPEHRAFVLYSF